MAICSKCHGECVIELDPDDFDEATSSAAGGLFSTVPDDLQLSCNCRWHWQCLFDEARDIASFLACPNCHAKLLNPTNPGTLLVRYINEGGTQDELDILPMVKEEAYLEAHPAARPARAFMTMCCEGDVAGVVELLVSQEEEIETDDLEGSMKPSEILRYQDPLDGMRSALHLALEKSQSDTVWLLLWLTSTLDSSVFPQDVIQMAQILGAGRENSVKGLDIRTLQDVEGHTAEFTAVRMGEIWSSLLRSGVLRM